MANKYMKKCSTSFTEKYKSKPQLVIQLMKNAGIRDVEKSELKTVAGNAN